MKETIKQKIRESWDKNFDDRNPKDIKEAETLYNELLAIAPREVIIEAAEELRTEAGKAVEKTRKEFYKK